MSVIHISNLLVCELCSKLVLLFGVALVKLGISENIHIINPVYILQVLSDYTIYQDSFCCNPYIKVCKFSLSAIRKVYMHLFLQKMCQSWVFCRIKVKLLPKRVQLFIRYLSRGTVQMQSMSSIQIYDLIRSI